MIPIIVLSIIFIIYFNIVRFVELHDLTNVYTWKDYWRYNNGISKTINFTLLLIMGIFLVVTYFKNN